MGVIGIAGREGSGKTRACVEEIRALLRRGERALYLVPEQDTVEAELFLSRELNLDVLWNLEVLSPTRLAQRIRGEAGGSARVLLTDAGRAMALKGALLSLRGSLRYFSQGSQGAADQIGDLLASGQKHDGRAPDYDDWALNGDILVYYPVLDIALELSSMGIRVDENSLAQQLQKAGCPERANLPFQKAILEKQLPYTIGGGIGQSRICMFYLRKAHIGEVQCSLWPQEIEEACAARGIHLL